MTNKYPGICNHCGKWVATREGNYERKNGKWEVVHFECVQERQKEKERKLEERLGLKQ